jgi:histidinol-phosphatase
MMVLDGIADIWVEGGVKPWDLAHAKILIEEAGGVFTDFEGIETIESGNAIACSRALSSQVLSIMRQQGKGPK